MGNAKRNPNQMPLRMLFDALGHVRLRGVQSSPDGTLRAIDAEFDGDPGEVVEFVTRMRKQGVEPEAECVDDGEAVPLLPAAGGETP